MNLQVSFTAISSHIAHTSWMPLDIPTVTYKSKIKHKLFILLLINVFILSFSPSIGKIANSSLY